MDHYSADPFFLSGGSFDHRPIVDLPNDTLLDERFRILRHLGSGVSAVYLAEDLLMGNQIAVKVIEVSSRPMNDNGLKRFQIEKQVDAYVTDHTHIRKVFDVHLVQYSDRRIALLAMEYVDGETLKDWVLRPRNDRETKICRGIEILVDIASGLMAYTRAGILPMDLNPQNILVTIDRVLLSDQVGLISGMPQDGFSRPSQMAAHTFFAPELLVSDSFEGLDLRALSYSFGLLALIVLHPHSEQFFEKSWIECRLCAPFDWKPGMQGIEPPFIPLLSRCLGSSPRERYGDFDELHHDLIRIKDAILTPGKIEKDSDDETLQLWTAAEEMYDKKNYEKARIYCEAFLTHVPSHPEAQARLAEIDRKFSLAEELYLSASQRLECGYLREAVELTREGALTYPEHPKAQAILVKLEAQVARYRAHVQGGTNAARNRNWESAAHYFEQAAEENKDDSDVGALAHFFCNLSKYVHEQRNAIDISLMDGDITKAELLASSLDLIFEEIDQWISEGR